MHTNNFFLDIFNKLLKINNNDIIIIFDNKNNIWFAFKELLKALEYSNYKKASNKLKIDKIFIVKYKNIGVPLEGYPLQPDKKFINEHGLYQLLSISTKPLAKIFMNEYLSNIMPIIRKNGLYIMDEQSKHKLDKINNKLIKVQHDNKKLLNNQRNVIYPEGKSLYVIIKIIDNKKYYKVGYTIDLNKRLKVYNTSFPYKIFFNYYVLVNDPLIDKCIKNIMRNEEFIKNKEYYKTTFNKILKFIKLCDKRLNKICCGYCLKYFNFDKIKLHKCKYI